MPLTSLSDQGIDVPLSEYNRLRAFQGGGWFWDHDNQQVIREVLGDFLPRVEERRERGGALFQHFVGGTEMASRSQAVGAQMNRVPRSEYQRLQRALENLKRKAQDPHTDPNARKVIEKFCLPDPSKDPDLYRLHGSGWNRRLLVLWGCEREEGTSLAPAAALQRIAVESPGTTFLRRLPMLLLWLLLLLLLVVGAYWLWQRHGEKQSKVAAQNVHGQATALNDSGGAADRNSPGRLVSAAGNPTPTPHPSTAVVTDAASPAGGNVGIDTADHSRTDTSATTHPGASPDDPRQRVLPANAAHATTRELAGASPAASPAAAGPLATAAARDARMAQAGQIADTRDAANQSTVKQIAQPATGDQPAATPAPSSDAPVTKTEGNRTVTMGKDANGLPEVELLKAQSDYTPHDGKIDVVIIAVVHDGHDGKKIPFEVKGWTVDNQPQQDRTGKEVTSEQINLSLSPGKHYVGVSATAQGASTAIEEALNVQIKSQGDVTLTPRETK